MALLQNDLVFNYSIYSNPPRILVMSDSLKPQSRWRDMTESEFLKWFPKPADQCQLKLKGSKIYSHYLLFDN